MVPSNRRREPPRTTTMPSWWSIEGLSLPRVWEAGARERETQTGGRLGGKNENTMCLFHASPRPTANGRRRDEAGLATEVCRRTTKRCRWGWCHVGAGPNNSMCFLRLRLSWTSTKTSTQLFSSQNARPRHHRLRPPPRQHPQCRRGLQRRRVPQHEHPRPQGEQKYHFISPLPILLFRPSCERFPARRALPGHSFPAR